MVGAPQGTAMPRTVIGWVDEASFARRTPGFLFGLARLGSGRGAGAGRRWYVEPAALAQS